LVRSVADLFLRLERLIAGRIIRKTNGEAGSPDGRRLVGRVACLPGDGAERAGRICRPLSATQQLGHPYKSFSIDLGYGSPDHPSTQESAGLGNDRLLYHLAELYLPNAQKAKSCSNLINT